MVNVESFLEGDTPEGEFLSKSDALIYQDHLRQKGSICAHCKFWSQGEKPVYGIHIDLKDRYKKQFPELLFNLIENNGDCRRYPPVFLATDEEELAEFPLTRDVDWCGEYADRNTEGVGE